CHAVVLFADNVWSKDTRSRVQRVNRRVDTKGRDIAVKVRRRIQVSERSCWSWVSVVVRWNVNRLNGRDRTLLRRSDALLKSTHVRRKCRLITNCRRDTTEKGRNFGTRLRETEDVVDEE